MQKHAGGSSYGQGIRCFTIAGARTILTTATREKTADFLLDADGDVLNMPPDFASSGAGGGAIGGVGEDGDGAAGALAQPRRGWFDRLEAYLSRLSTRNNFWHKVFSLVWLPYAFRSGIAMKRIDSKTFRAVLPFKRINRNWYNAMAGAALLGNSEVAAGMYLFSPCGSDYIVVCKSMNYRFLRPCFGPAVYEVVRSEELAEKIASGGEFNIDIEMEIRQQLHKKGREVRVGRCEITFHCTPKTMMRERKARGKT